MIRNPLDIKDIENRLLNLEKKFTDEQKRVHSFFEVLWQGILSADINGGTLDGVNYSFYYLDFIIHHNFSKIIKDSIPFYIFYDYFKDPESSPTYQALKFNKMKELTVDGNHTKDYYHSMYRIKEYNGTVQEYLHFGWVITWVSGTVTIPAQNVKILPIIFYANFPLTLYTPSPPSETGGGGIIVETFHFYI